MAITDIEIHPAIGIARIGDSPDEFFIGPERPGEKPAPEDGFKDADCRVKRQGARFHVFATHDDGSIEELTDEEAEISWTVHLANGKAAERTQPGTDSDLTIDPGSRTLDGPNDRTEFDSGTISFQGAPTRTVPLGEMRTDTDGKLIVLGGRGESDSPTGASISNFLNNNGWYDDVSDGPVTASVTIRDTGETFTPEGAWVIVAPPKFAPGLDNVITLYDRLYDLMADHGHVTPPSTPSYTEHVHPFLKRADQSQWVTSAGGSAHSGGFSGAAGSWTEPVYDQQSREYVFSWLRAPDGTGGTMPALSGSPSLPPTQYGWMEQWRNDDFLRDWSGPPDVPAEVTPEGLDEAALENCVGAAFYPGIEAGGVAQIPILDASNYTGAFRLDHAALDPGDVTAFMALPWQADFKACGATWWPVPRPVEVTPQSGSSSVAWDRDVPDYEAMVSEWSSLGFVVEQEGEYVEVDRCDTPFVTLLTPSIAFTEVPQGPMGMTRTTGRAIEFEVVSTGSAVTLEIPPGGGPSHPRINALDTSVTVGPTTGSSVEKARLWISYQTGSPDEELTDSVVVEDTASGDSWTIDVSASTDERKTAAVALVLDRSGSMSEDRGDGVSKHESLQEAASTFVDVMLEDDAVSLVRYNQDAQQLKALTTLGPASPFDPARAAVKDVIQSDQLDPSGATSIGDGIHEGRDSLTAASGFDVESLLVLTDGKENRERSIADVAPDIDEQTYAVGLGQPSNTSAPALQSISGNHGGYLLITGDIDRDDEFVLQKYFLQVLAGVSNAEVVLDPEGVLPRGSEHRIPFQLTDVDTGIDVILLTPHTGRIDFRLQTPNGSVIEPWRAEVDPAMRWNLSENVTYYRMSLPAEVRSERFEGPGKWHALLRHGKPQVRPDEADREELADLDERIEGRASGRSRSTGRERGRERPSALAREQPGEPTMRARDRLATFVRGERPESTHESPPERGEGFRYSLLVHAYSDLRMDATLQQNDFEPGADLDVRTTITEANVPVDGADVWAEVARPDGTSDTVTLEPRDEGQYAGTIGTSPSGVYSVRVRARGRTRRGLPFQREQRLNGAVWNGGNQDAEHSRTGGGTGDGQRERDRLVCATLECLFRDDGALGDELQERLKEYGVDLDELHDCLRRYCHGLDRGAIEEGTDGRESIGSFESIGELANVESYIRELLREERSGSD
ncbi:LodA/GoxA family CTQ-dependent oxidase [Salinigranum sp. GCM10025319]|uniref:LodA/GoxA family CTQ-dependent oxidase n=1 Tax=Salinigranum sp. GCM10025319 TaxID=3252687 RepID=UPI0036142467